MAKKQKKQRNNMFALDDLDLVSMAAAEAKRVGPILAPSHDFVELTRREVQEHELKHSAARGLLATSPKAAEEMEAAARREEELKKALVDSINFVDTQGDKYLTEKQKQAYREIFETFVLSDENLITFDKAILRIAGINDKLGDLKFRPGQILSMHLAAGLWRQQQASNRWMEMFKNESQEKVLGSTIMDLLPVMPATVSRSHPGKVRLAEGDALPKVEKYVKENFKPAERQTNPEHLEWFDKNAEETFGKLAGADAAVLTIQMTHLDIELSTDPAIGAGAARKVLKEAGVFTDYQIAFMTLWALENLNHKRALSWASAIIGHGVLDGDTPLAKFYTTEKRQSVSTSYWVGKDGGLYEIIEMTHPATISAANGS